MRLQQYLTENRSKKLSIDQFLKELPKYHDILKYYYKGGTLILRGGTDVGDVGIISPSKFEERRSAYTSNYYTLISSNDPSWKHIPKRSMAVVGATDYDKVDGYNEDIYIVLPRNGTIIAQSPTEDFWGSFNHAFGDDPYPLRNFNNSLTKVFNYVGINDDPDGSLSELKKACKAVDVYISNNEESFEGFIRNVYDTGYAFERAMRNISYKGDLYKWLTNIFDPKNISTIKAGGNLKEGVETWSSDDCLVINYNEYRKFKDDKNPLMMEIFGQIDPKVNPEFKNTQMKDQLGYVRIGSWDGEVMGSKHVISKSYDKTIGRKSK